MALGEKSYIFFQYFTGTENEIELNLVYPKSATKYFDLDGKSLKLIQPLDRDADDLSSLQLSVRLKFVVKFIKLVD